MSNRATHLFRLISLIVLGMGASSLPKMRASAPAQSATPSASGQPSIWQSTAKLHHGFQTARGTLIFDANGVEFLSEQRFSHRWPFIEIESVDLSPRRVIVTTYENRGWWLSGDRRFLFDINESMPSGVARDLVERVAKPAQNREPEPAAPSFAAIPARHKTRTGGSNGVLRLRDGGIDYVTAFAQEARSWRWADIQTLANPDPYHFRVAGYRETFEFELKKPMSSELFDKLWDHVYARDLSVGVMDGGKQ